MIQLLVSSFYNTLIDEEDAIPTSTMLAFDRIRKNTKIAILTNRLEEEVLYYNRDYPFIDYIVSLNGGILYDVEKATHHSFATFTKEEVEEIESLFPKNKVKVLSGDSIYKIEVSLEKRKQKLPKIKNYQVSILERNKEFFLEIGKNTPYEAIKKIMEINSLQPDNVLAIIGNDSEIPIAEHIKNCYGIENASKKLKKLTKKTTSNLEKGVEKVIEKEMK